MKPTKGQKSPLCLLQSFRNIDKAKEETNDIIPFDDEFVQLGVGDKQQVFSKNLDELWWQGGIAGNVCQSAIVQLGQARSYPSPEIAFGLEALAATNEEIGNLQNEQPFLEVQEKVGRVLVVPADIKVEKDPDKVGIKAAQVLRNVEVANSPFSNDEIKSLTNYFLRHL